MSEKKTLKASLGCAMSKRKTQARTSFQPFLLWFCRGQGVYIGFCSIVYMALMSGF